MMDKSYIDHFLRITHTRVSMIWETVSQDSSYASTAEKLKKILVLIDECKKELETW